MDLQEIITELEIRTATWTTESFIAEDDDYISGIADGFRAATQLVKDLRTSRENNLVEE